VEFESATLTRLATPETRAEVFDELALRHLLSAAYDYGPDELGDPPFTPSFDEFQLGFSATPLVTIEGTWATPGGAPSEVRLRVHGMAGAPSARVDAVWRGTITARLPSSLAPLERVVAEAPAWPDLATLDAEIQAGPGGLPSDPNKLEAARRARLAARLRERLDDPASLADGRADAVVAGWLRQAGAGSVAELLHRSHVGGAAVQVAFAEAPPAPQASRSYPIAAAVLVRGAGFSLPELLAESKALAERLEPLGLARAPDHTVRTRASVVVAWVVPAAVFDDPGWPGADADQRLQAAGRWLTREGIALIATTPPS
jgi:hypothetical protein